MRPQIRARAGVRSVAAVTVAPSTVRESEASAVPNVPSIGTRRGGTMALTLQIRPVRSDDAVRLVDLHNRCSDQARYFRFHAAKPRLRAVEAEYLAAVDGEA